MNDPGAIILQSCGLGRFVSAKTVDALREEDLVIYSSLRYLELFWVAREREHRQECGIGCEDLVEREQREVEQ